MSNVLKMLSRGGAAAAETDPNFNQTVLLLHGDGTNGAQNNTFLDGSTNNFTITRNGNTTQGTFSPFSLAAGEWSNYFDGSGDFLSVAGSSNFNSTGDFTMEAWAYITSASSYGGIISLSEGTFGSGGRITILNTGFLEFAISGSGGSGGGSYSGTAVPLNQWFHVALVRSGSSTNNCSAYLNGSRVGQFTSTSQVNTASNVCVIGRYYASGTNQYWTTGYIASARYVVGTALYSGATYTVPTAPLTAISGTQLLTCQSNRFVDNSTNAFAITRNGDVRVTPFSPFAPSAAYSASTNGGSGYFDGTGDYLQIADADALDLSTGDFTIQGWIFGLDAVADVDGIVGKRSQSGGFAGWRIAWDIASGVNKLEIAHAATGTEHKTSVINKNEWVHFAFTRTSGTLRCYANGVVGDVVSNYTHDFSNAHPFVIATNVPNEGLDFPGYISGVQVLKGTSLYSDSTYTVPTAPPTAITNTSLLLNFTNAGILDNTGKNNLETVGNAQIDTTTKKFGTGSMEFDGTGDYLTIPNSDIVALGTGDFTIEFWANLTAYSFPNGAVVRLGNETLSSGLFVGYVSTSGVFVYGNNTTITSTGNSFISTGTWQHIAVVRSSGSIQIYVDGTARGSSASYTQNITPTINSHVGGYPSAQYFNGFIDDLRITKGVARYTANFTAPIKEFPDL